MIRHTFAAAYGRSGEGGPGGSAVGVTTMTVSALDAAAVVGDETGKCIWIW